MDYDTVDFLSESSIVDNPYPYYDYLRHEPARFVPPHGILAITGYDEAITVWRDPDTFSSCNAFGGPFPGLPVEPGADDISDTIAEHRHVYPISEHLTTFDPPEHTKHRAVLMHLLTPKRLQDNEAFMWRLADELIDRFVDAGRCNFVRDYADPFAWLSIAGLLGVPEEDHRLFQPQLDAHVAGALGQQAQGNPFAFLDDLFTGYVEDRRRSPRDDVMTKLAHATFPDGSTPEVVDIVRVAVFLFAAGQGTTAHLLASLLQQLGDRPPLQAKLRENRELIPTFIEETLRMESPVKATFRLARRTTTLGGVRVPAGTTVMLMPGAMNRDARAFDDADSFDIGRPGPMRHLAFGRGIHACPGASLARLETRISLERLLTRLADIEISVEHHGPPDARRYQWNPTFILRGLQELHLEFRSVSG